MTDWAQVEEYPRYSVSVFGEVRNDQTGRILRPKINQYNVVYVGMMGEDGKQHHRSLSLLVARAFMPNDLPAFDTPINLDGDRWHCSIDNLMWRPRWFAIQYHQQFKRRYDVTIEVPIRDLSTGEVYSNSWDVCTRFGLLEKDLVMAVDMRTFVWPTYQTFDLAD